MKILAIETAGKVCGVSVLENDKVIKEAILEDANTHSVKLMPLIDQVLKEANLTINDIDLFACDKGPGSFTGIRIGIATIKAFADVTAKKVIGITSLENLACYEKDKSLICTMIDAKNDNVYYGIFRKEKESYSLVSTMQFGSITQAIEAVKPYKEDIAFIGDGCLVHQELIKQEIGTRATIRKEVQLNSTHIGILAYSNREAATDTNHLTPTYLRKSNAERMLENKK